MSVSLSRIIIATLFITTLFVFFNSMSYAGDISVDGQFVSYVTTGTAPLVTSSQTQVNNLNSEFLGGHSADSLRVHALVTVGKNGTGDFATIQEAINSRGDNFTVLVGPGVYKEQITMFPRVRVVGSGMGVTTITYTGSLADDATAATVNLSYGSPNYLYSLSDLTIVSDPEDTGSLYSIGVYFDADASNKANIERVFIYIKNPKIAGIGVKSKAPLNIRDSEIFFFSTGGALSSYGIWNEQELTLDRVKIKAQLGQTNYAIYNYGPQFPLIYATLHNSHITGNIGSSEIPAYITRVLHSQRGPLGPATWGADVECVGVLHLNTYYPAGCGPSIP